MFGHLTCAERSAPLAERVGEAGRTRHRSPVGLALLAVACWTGLPLGQAVVVPAVSRPLMDPVRAPGRRAIVLVGDSTVRNGGAGEGWGDHLAPLVDPAQVQVLNWALGGRSTRSFIGEGRWAKALAQMTAGDVVLVQFGHNDQRPLTTARGTIPGAGNETATVVSDVTGQPTTVRSYGWYLRQYVRGARQRQATVVLCTPVPRNWWNPDGSFDDVMGAHARWVKQVASEERVPVIDLHAIVMAHYLALGRATVTSKYFTAGDATHTNADGARAAAVSVIDLLRAVPALGLGPALKPTAALLAAPPPEPAWARGIEGQRKADLGNGYYLNPILAGDHPDPSVLRDGDDYYLTCSSFDAYPGLVIWHSRDLVNWRPLGPSLFKNVGSVWAPDLVKHRNRYYIYFPGIGRTRSNYVIWADRIGGPWSDPIDLGVGRIDPGHAVDRDGRRYLFLSGGYMVPLADDGLSVVGAPTKVFDGWRYPDDWVVEAFAQEGPKIFERGGYYHMVLALGGTAGPPTGHMIVAARSRSLLGPWEHSPYNPLVRTTSAGERWWSKGHGTLVEGPGGRWFLVYHAYENGFASLGRQTLLEPVEWLDNGWFRSAHYDVSRPIPKAGGDAVPHGQALSDDFSTNRMGTQWSFYGGDVEDRERYRYDEGGLVIRATGTGPADSSPLWCIAGDLSYEIEVEIDADPGASAGLLLFYSRRLYAGLGYSAAKLIMHSYGLDRPQARPAPLGRHLHIRLRNERQIVSMYSSSDGRVWERFDRRIDVSGYHHNVAYDFLSLRPALFAAGTGEVRFRRFTYRALE